MRNRPQFSRAPSIGQRGSMASGMVRVMLLVLVLGACGGSGGGGPTVPGGGGSGGGGGGGGSGGGGGACPSASICLRAASFEPNSLTVPRGTTVPFINESGVQHNVTFASSSIANIGNHSNGTNSRTFSNAGTFGFQCTLHAGMTGQIVVQ